GRSDLASKAPPPWCAAPAIVGQNLRVSRTILWHNSGNISIIYAKLNNAISLRMFGRRGFSIRAGLAFGGR
ncbi:MAG TPA: hypothetical protein VGO59_01350, partial [Verrucomicrobiae bacterium]